MLQKNYASERDAGLAGLVRSAPEKLFCQWSVNLCISRILLKPLYLHRDYFQCVTIVSVTV